MKKHWIFTLLGFATISILSFTQTLTVYLPSNYYTWIKNLPQVNTFEQTTHTNIRFVSFDGTGKMVARLLLEKKHPKADVIMGLSQANVLTTTANDLLANYTSPASKQLKASLKTFQTAAATPFDYGNLAILYNPKKVPNPPTSLMALAKSNYPFIICDPRTSSTGEDFLLWTISALGPQWSNFWKLSSSHIRYIAPSWDSAFAQFEAGTAPIMISYASDEAYSYQTYHQSQYKVMIPKEGAFMEVESIALGNKPNVSPTAKQFIDLMLSPSVQATVPLGNWMLPAIQNVPLPPVFEQHYPLNAKALYLSPGAIEKNLSDWIAQWQNIVLN